MSRVRVVLYAEGPGETGGRDRLLPPPGSPLPEDALGPGHILVRRCLLESDEVHTKHVQFETPLRDQRGRTVKGSMLLTKPTLRRILTWFDPAKRPDLAIVLVDQDEDTHRKNLLEKHVDGLPSFPVVGVAIQEFEAWLIADHSCVAKLLSCTLQPPKNPEKMRRREAKALLSDWIRQCTTELESDEIRRQIASMSNLETIAKACVAFGTFRKEITTSLK